MLGRMVGVQSAGSVLRERGGLTVLNLLSQFRHPPAVPTGYGNRQV